VYIRVCGLIITHIAFMQGLLERVLAGTSVRGPESKEGACESLKGPIALAIDILF
jgi:hypothetical protein